MEILKIAKLVQAGKILVLPTDTIYGIVGSALKPEIVEKIYNYRKRSLDKPMIILISSIDDLKQFGIQLDSAQSKILKKIWPNPISVILPCSSKEFEYLHRGKKSLAFRIPKKDFLLKLLKETGPLVAPSANFEGEKPSESIDQSKAFFGENVDFYLDGGTLKSQPSTLIELDKNWRVLREGLISKQEIKRLLE